MFFDGKPHESFRRRMVYRFLRTPRYRHNQTFTPTQTIEREPDGGFVVRWPPRSEVRARPIHQLPRHGEVASIVASGPSIQQLDRPERLFRVPAACVNGAVKLAKMHGVRVPYYSVTDLRFVRQQPELFALGVELADAVILRPTAIFAAMETTPGLLDRATVYLHDDLRFPFKRRRTPLARMALDPRFLTHQDAEVAYSTCPSSGTYPAGTVVYPTVQVLFGIGYRRLFMFGVDLSAGSRFYRETDASPSRLGDAYSSKILPGFELVRTYCRQTGKTLVNCSWESRLPESVIPKLDGSEALERLAGESSAGG